MDYGVAALKLLCGQLKDARETPCRNALALGGIIFQRAWLQGVLVSDDAEISTWFDSPSNNLRFSITKTLGCVLTRDDFIMPCENQLEDYFKNLNQIE